MAVTVKGFQGTISDVDMATQSPYHPPLVGSSADAAVTAVAGARRVSVAAGSTLVGFVKRTSDAAELLDLGAPTSGGKWYAITVDRQWSPTNTATLKADDLGVATDGNNTSIPEAAYAAAAALPSVAGTVGSPGGHRQILALVHVRAADSTLVIADARWFMDTEGRSIAADYVAFEIQRRRRAPAKYSRVVAANTGWEFRWNGTKWCPWNSPWQTKNPDYTGWNTGNNGGGGGKWRWENGKVVIDYYLLIGSSASNSDVLRFVNLPEPVRFYYNSEVPPELPGSKTVVYDPGFQQTFVGTVRVDGENVARLQPQVYRADGTFLREVGVGGGQPFQSGMPQSGQIWVYAEYESANYPLDV